jgi:DNA replicative helicase MCM subunit Mcm2 (Cdc46/Mcm family)
MFYSKVKFYCNNCGKEMIIEWTNLMGREFKVCSSNCVKEIELKRAYSIMGSQYKEDK